MAQNYIVTSQVRDVQVISPTLVNDVERVGINTQPHGVYVEYPVQIAQWQQNRGAEVLGLIAGGIESLMGGGLAVGGQFVQDFDNNGLLIDYLDVLVQYVPPDEIRPPMTTTVRIAVGMFAAAADPFVAHLGGSPQNLVLTAWEQLEAAANQ